MEDTLSGARLPRIAEILANIECSPLHLQAGSSRAKAASRERSEAGIYRPEWQVRKTCSFSEATFACTWNAFVQIQSAQSRSFTP